MDRLLKAAERLMSMDDHAWERHANPWSAWSRMSGLPLIALAIWSRVWLGWGALIPLAAAIAWIWINPRLFAAPSHLNAWASQGVMGERVLLRHRERVDAHHRLPLTTLTAVTAIGVLPFAWGLWALDVWAVVAGMAIVILSKLWFVDRCAWIWHDFQRSGGTVDDLNAGAA